MKWERTVVLFCILFPLLKYGIRQPSLNHFILSKFVIIEFEGLDFSSPDCPFMLWYGNWSGHDYSCSGKNHSLWVNT
eukprot:UN18552